MPNYIRNILKIESTSEKIEEVLKAIQSDTDPEQLFDFNKILPMPKSLEITTGSQEDLTQLYITYINPQVDYYGIQSNNDPIPTIKQNPFLPRYRDDLSKEEIDKMLQRFGNYSEEQCLEIGKQYYDNYLQHGATSWYHWCIDNWGTKWNASDVYLVSDDILVFNTAWNHPEPVIQRLSDMFNVNVKLAYADEDIYNNYLNQQIKSTEDQLSGSIVSMTKYSDELLKLYVRSIKVTNKDDLKITFKSGLEMQAACRCTLMSA